MDLTDFSNLLKPQRQASIPVTTANPNSVPAPVFPTETNPIKKSHWSITGAFEDGQVNSGEVDEAQKEFLKTTEFVK